MFILLRDLYRDPITNEVFKLIAIAETHYTLQSTFNMYKQFNVKNLNGYVHVTNDEEIILS